MARRAVAGLAVLVAWLAGAGCIVRRVPLPDADGGSPWVEAQSAHFRVRTPMGEADARRLALELERARRAQLLLFGPRFDPPTRVEAVVLPSPRDLALFVGRAEEREFDEGEVGLSISTPSDEPLLVLADGMFVEDSVGGGAVAHMTLAPTITRAALWRQPTWLARGLSQYLGTTLVAAADGAVSIGRANRGALGLLRRQDGPLGLQRLWAWEDPALYGHLEASAWLWVHYLYNVQTDRFGRFLGQLRQGVEPRAAWAQAFAGVSDGELMDGAVAYLARGNFRVLTLPAPPSSAGEVAVRPLPPAEVHALHAWLLAQQAPRGESEAKAHRARVDAALDGALRLDPAHPDAAWLRAQRAKATPEALVQVARASTAAHPTDARAWEHLAAALARAGAPEAEPEAALRKALEAGSERPDTLAWLAALRVRHGDSDEAQSLVSRALRLNPGHAGALRVGARVAAARGACEPAAALAQRALAAAEGQGAEDGARELQEEMAAVQRSCRPGSAGSAPVP